MLCAENGCFTRDRRVARPMNPLLSILFDAEFSNDLQAFDDAREVLLDRRFRPFAQPREWRSAPVADHDQCLQSGNRFLRQIVDEVLVCALSGASAGGQAHFLQGNGGWKQYASFAQVRNHRGNDRLAAIRACRFIERDFGGGAIIFAPKWAHPKVCLEFPEMLPASLVTPRVSGKRRGLASDLRGDEVEHLDRRIFLRA